eukprot:CAMPEP_0177580658 /NCGR_PEP_ID=MMETSP0419_2-20121207/1695_1 /TAXON_ID=582737 /ORGANISM="Tetraselmis sp., Strain GSL018" /LENGTH=44 /DNA_ID= /DNA_START= /DNA_END= /DNA_ORIENTATION=
MPRSRTGDPGLVLTRRAAAKRADTGGRSNALVTFLGSVPPSPAP